MEALGILLGEEIGWLFLIRYRGSSQRLQGAVRLLGTSLISARPDLCVGYLIPLDRAAALGAKKIHFSPSARYTFATSDGRLSCLRGGQSCPPRTGLWFGAVGKTARRAMTISRKETFDAAVPDASDAR